MTRKPDHNHKEKFELTMKDITINMPNNGTWKKVDDKCHELHAFIMKNVKSFSAENSKYDQRRISQYQRRVKHITKQSTALLKDLQVKVLCLAVLGKKT